MKPDSAKSDVASPHTSGTEASNAARPGQHPSGPPKLSLTKLVPGSVIGFSLVTNILMLTGPLFMLQVYDRVLSSGSVSTLVALSILVAILYTLYGFLEFVRGRIMTRVGQQIDERYRHTAFNMVSHYAKLGKEQVGLAPMQDLVTVRNFVSGPGPLAFLDMPWAPIYLFVIYLMHPLLGLASLCAVLLLAGLAMLNHRLITEPTEQSQKAQAAAQNLGAESRRNVETSSVLGMTNVVRDRWTLLQTEALEAQTSASDKGGAITASSRTLRLVFQSAILALGAYLAVRQQISPGTMIAASIIMSRALAPVEQSVTHWQAFVSFRQAWKRFATLMADLPKPVSRLSLPAPQGRVSVEALTIFSQTDRRPLLQGISFQLEPGSGLGIIGPTGAGKTTLARALTGNWPLKQGVVRLDGADLDHWDPVELGPYLGYLPQRVDLFEGTISQNIARFQTSARPDDIVEAAKQAAVHDMIQQLPDGYNTEIGPGGGTLSAGQCQRIGLARALYGQPALVILDEPNANLDAEGEAALIKAVLSVRARGGTVILVAHRPSAIAALDKLMMLRNGRMMAFGDKDEVLAKVIATRSAAEADGAQKLAVVGKPLKDVSA
ncbi:MAG: type I secretion system permease/ATPase [Hyphomicrobiales bacterium]